MKHFITFLRFACQFFGFCLSNINYQTSFLHTYSSTFGSFLAPIFIFKNYIRNSRHSHRYHNSCGYHHRSQCNITISAHNFSLAHKKPVYHLSILGVAFGKPRLWKKLIRFLCILLDTSRHSVRIIIVCGFRIYSVIVSEL